jgi:putative pantetheine hydrolase
VAGVDVRGGGPGTRETDALDPRNLVPEVHAICLTGGSAYGLAAADGVMAWLEERGIGFPVGPEPGHVVPIVPTAVLFDLGRGGTFSNRPDADFGRHAAAAAARGRHPARVVLGSVGAGAGAQAGRLTGGIGSASTLLAGGSTVAALVAVNAVGAVFDPATGVLFGARVMQPGDGPPRRPRPAEARAAVARLASVAPPLNTTIGIVGTDATLTKAQVQKLAGMAHDGLARAVHPAHLLSDGDTFFGLATCARPVTGAPGGRSQKVGAEAAEAAAVAEAAGTYGESLADAPSEARAAIQAVNELLAAAADVVTRAIVRAVLAAAGRPDTPSYLDLFPTRVERRPHR